jgi:2-keto-3-deoxy-6-phosphogluconate aldolase
VIVDVKQSYGDEMLVGAGTLVTHAQVAEAAEAGASWLAAGAVAVGAGSELAARRGEAF